MKKIKNKLWLDRKSKKLYFNKLKRISRKKMNIVTKSNIHRNICNNTRIGRRKTIVPPNKFSILYNTIDTLLFFESLEKEVNRGMPVIIDMSNIDILTIDSIMYLLVILRYYKEVDNKEYDLKVRYPKNDTCNNLLRASGFHKYSQTREITIEPVTDQISIKNGTDDEPRVIKKICDFVIDKFDLNKVNTKKLYNMITELMLNTRQHAYIDIKNSLHEWYIFVKASKENDKIEFIYVDTGSGIPKTIRKNLKEKVTYWMTDNLDLNQCNESKLIESALEGITKRSRTGHSYRGKGLPKINSFLKQGYIRNLKILSNCGYYSEIEKKDIDKCFRGTLFYWELIKGDLNENL